MLARTELLYTLLAIREAKRAVRIPRRCSSCTAFVQQLRAPEVQHRDEQKHGLPWLHPRPRLAVRDQQPRSGRRTERMDTTKRECEVPALQRVLDETQLHY